MVEKKLTYRDLAAAARKSPVYLAGAGPEAIAALSAYPVRAEFPATTDPFQYRLLEIVGVYGDALRFMANEMFGDGMMSAIDFTMDVEKVTGNEGEARMKITMNGKWLPYKQV